MSPELNTISLQESIEQVLDPRRVFTVTQRAESLMAEHQKLNRRVPVEPAKPSDERSPALKASPAQKMLCAVGDWSENRETPPVPVSGQARVMHGHGYKTFALAYGDTGFTALTLRAAGADVLELHTIISYPDRRGNGATTMRRLCGLADDLGVRIWLDALPFGRGRKHIPLDKLLEFYRGFGFFRIHRVEPTWLNGYHSWDRYRSHRPMLRNPSPPSRR